MWTKTWGDLTRCYTSLSCTCLSIIMTFEHYVKCLWQHPGTSNLLEITKIEWIAISDPVVITAHSLRQLQPGNRKIPIKPRTGELTNLLSAQQEFTKLPHNKNILTLTRHLVRMTRHSFISVNIQSLTTKQQGQNETKQTTIKPVQWSRCYL